ncbi:hypothetical protein Bca52824_015369 [Brassica carinata]|uniref:Leucine-rich repeat-containing N-terminal plant-type domain-containing protein n=1 Tax=Brassica carinata TaxID=52824 RepID=A0A8X7W2E1_BRACI|nr:hypothetical protein Bca52824_015369 [Brassica carinata]
MERKLFVGQYLMILVILLLLGQLHGYKSCIEKERMALLDLKKYHLPSNESNSIFNTWVNDTRSDCCQWEGPFNWLDFLRKSSLNLSLLHPFEEVQILDLSESVFSGFFDDVEGFRSLRRLRSLEVLDLSINEFNNSIFPFLNAATSLKALFLGTNSMNGPFPVQELKDLTNLELLDLSDNRFNGSLPVRVLPALKKLKALDLHLNEFSATMELQGICELKNMQELNIGQNKFVGQFPLCLTSLTGLRVLDLSSNQLSGKLPSEIHNLESLEYFLLSDNGFEGVFSFGLLSNLSELKVFKLDSQSNSLQVVSDTSWKPKFQLNVIELRSCNLEKNNSFTSFQLPKSAHKLLFLNISDNEFTHIFPENIGWTLPHLKYMNLANNGFQGNVPSSLGNIKSIEYMDISHNSFSGKLPQSFGKGCYSLGVLKMSHNKLSGDVFPESWNFSFVNVLYMDNNQFTGKIGQGLRNMRSLVLLDISNNNLTGVIPNWFDEIPYIGALLVSNNLLEGEIPISLFRTPSLQLLDLSANNLSGNIPPQANFLQVLLLQDNILSGVIQDTLIGNVTVLDLRNNRLLGNIPDFINTQSIRILILRGNNLTGRIPRQLLCDRLRNIHFLDLSNNRLSGSIPSCLSNTSVAIGSTESSPGSLMETASFSRKIYVGAYVKSLLMLDQLSTLYNYKEATKLKVQLATKHRYDDYMGQNLELFFGLDLSANELTGEIPVELGGLMEFHTLNFSHNKLSGAIPESFSGMKNMESLDLSYNKLQGWIPPQLTELSSLAIFNVSFNNLSGVIPQGKQFNTFDTGSYLSNPLLCGKPTRRNCDSKTIDAQDNVVENEESTIDMESMYWSLAAAYVTTLLGVFTSLSFDSPWSRFWFYMVDAVIHKVRDLLW